MHQRWLALLQSKLAHVGSQIQRSDLGLGIETREALLHGHPETGASCIVNDDVGTACTNFLVYLVPCFRVYRAARDISWVARMQMDHGGPSLIGSIHRVRDFIGRFGN